MKRFSVAGAADSMNKYKNIPTVIDGIRFASKREGTRYSELKLLERANVIRDLRLQVPFVFEHNDIRICKYVADFVYRENGSEVVEDCKGHRTKEYLIKRNLMTAFFNVIVRET